MVSARHHLALYLLRSGMPGLSSESRYFLAQLVLRFGGEWCAWTVEGLSRELKISRAAVARARKELLRARRNGSGAYIEESPVPATSRSDPEMLRGRPRKGIRLTESFRFELELLSVDQQPEESGLLFIEAVLLGQGDGVRKRKRGRLIKEEEGPAALDRLLLAVLWAISGPGGFVTVEEKRLRRLTGLSSAQLQYRLEGLKKLKYVRLEGESGQGRCAPEVEYRSIVLSQRHPRFRRVIGGQLIMREFALDELLSPWNVYKVAELGEGRDQRLRIERQLELWAAKIPEIAGIGLSPEADLIQAFRRHPESLPAANFMSLKICEYALVAMGSDSEGLISDEMVWIDSIFHRIKEEMFSDPKLPELVGSDDVKLLSAWVYLHVINLANRIIREVNFEERPANKASYLSGWQRCDCMSLLPSRRGRLEFWYVVDADSQG
ncbi:MAG: hypothetical protein COB48_00180 [Pseudoalteromonas sp.]|nr:MAG: hypothetical protein COB48_00180 [Pseudoalteromonas sp.]